MNRALSTICVVAACLSSTAQDAVPKISAREARNFVGKEATICGRVVTYDCSEARDTVLLNLDKPTWDRALSVGIPVALRDSFGGRVEDQYLGTQICATGRVERLDGRYVVRVTTPSAIERQPDSRVQKAPFAGGAVRECASGVMLPSLTHEVKPAYTRDAMRALIQGKMFLDAVVLPNGRVGDVRVIHSLDPGLDEQGVRAVRQWRFLPGRLHGEIVPMIVTIELSFTLK